ncbi:DoxX family protein [Saccharothrix coeruleofusca]|uniref:Oxidoreductase n=1 Tax=Saccharothrix coeruleofusca TaxID=33919 RepID=A0A918AJ75_9PSEU|nr:DoxX family protein [Saccharothrix coeruleofusca]MBP2338637.1 putative oxidoreductase [Saccharothrix coeruleofusca]GGP47024.1 hypothetical protein GCM10010185_18480 [Saccharothrix coeruleofusca]
MATHDDRSKAAGDFPDDGPYSPSGTAVGAHHFDDAIPAFDKGTSSFDTSGYTPIASLDQSSSPLDEVDERKPFGWTGSADLGLLALRLALGGVFVLHGAQKVFGLFGGPGIDGFANYLQGLGFREARVLAWVTGVTELGGGALLVLGLLTPLAAAGILGVMANVLVLNHRNGFFLPDGVEFEAVLAAMAFAVLFAGPGRAALDYNRAWFRHPLLSGFLCLLVAAGASAATLYVFR